MKNMMFKLSKKIYRLSLVVSIILILTSCDFIKKLTNPAEPSKDKITTGETVELGTKSVGSSGGEIIFTKSGDVLDGLSIKVADSSFGQGRDFKISYTKIESHKFNEYFIPITPMIKISNGGGYADRIIEVKVPAKVPAGEVPLAFFYDESNGKLEAVPVLSYDETSVTVGTRHFMTSSLYPSGGSKIVNLIQTEDPYSRLIISSLKEAIVNATPKISSGFKPGIDDWEFINYGSYLSPGGQCFGQTMAAMWYFYEKKANDAKLNKKFLDNPNIWQSNSRGYRFCSVIHEDINVDGYINDILWKYLDWNQSRDRLKWYIIAGAMLVTGEPQAIGIWRQYTDANGIKQNGGHELICYEISPTDGKLYISDPNTPGASQVIEYKNDRFQPYMAKLNGNDASHPYPFITYHAKTAHIEWNKIGKRYSELLNGTIGTIAPNNFPPYTIWVNDGSGYELTDGLNTDLDSLSLTVFCPTAEAYVVKDGKRALPFYVYDEEGKNIDKDWKNSSSYVKLKPGANKLGIYFVGLRLSSKDDNGNYNEKFIDFKWFNVTLNAVTIESKELDGAPIFKSGEIKKEYNFFASTKGLVPANSKFIWNFGDGTALVTKDKDTTAKHTYEKEGDFEIKLQIIDNNTSKLVTEAKVKVKIGSSVSIAGISPQKGPDGSLVAINGSGFGATKRDGDEVCLFFNGNDKDYRAIWAKKWSDTRIEAVINTETTKTGKMGIKIRLYDKDKMSYTWSQMYDFEVVPLQITSVKPDSVYCDSVITFTGSGFGEQSYLDSISLFGPDAYKSNQIISWTDTEIKCKIPKLYTTGSMYCYVNKPSKSYEASTKPYLKPTPSYLFDFLTRAVKSLTKSESSFWCDNTGTMTSYDMSGKITNKSTLNTILSYSFSDYKNKSKYTFNGTSFSISGTYDGSNDTYECTGTLSKDAKTVTDATIKRTRSDGKIIYRIVLSGLPYLTNDYTDLQFHSTYESTGTGSFIYLKELYYAVYYNNSDQIQYDIKATASKKISLMIGGRFD